MYKRHHAKPLAQISSSNLIRRLANQVTTVPNEGSPISAGGELGICTIPGLSLQQLQHNTAMQYYVLMLIITLFFVFQNIGRF